MTALAGLAFVSGIFAAPISVVGDLDFEYEVYNTKQAVAIPEPTRKPGLNDPAIPVDKNDGRYYIWTSKADPTYDVWHIRWTSNQNAVQGLSERVFMGDITITSGALDVSAFKFESHTGANGMLSDFDEIRYPNFANATGFDAFANTHEDGLDIYVKVDQLPAYLKFDLKMGAFDRAAANAGQPSMTMWSEQETASRIFIGSDKLTAHSEDFAFNIPEPTMLSMFGVGFLGMLGMGWIRRKS
jgi:hypothetical protein